MRIVDADYAHKQLTVAEVECGKNFETDCNHVRDFLNALPTIDAVPVVRCRECKHYRTGTAMTFTRNGEHIRCCSCEKFGRLMRDDDFCSYGERKDGDG